RSRHGAVRPAPGRRAMRAAPPRVLAGLLAVVLGASAYPAVAGEDQRPAILRDVAFDQRLGAEVPLDVAFRDETGARVTLRDYLGDKPVLLVPAYYECPMLCTIVLNGVVSALRALPFDVGKEFRVVTFSFNPRETSELAAAKKATYLEDYRRPGAAARGRRRLALPDGRRAVDRGPDPGDRLPLRLGRGLEAVRARQRHRRAHARRAHLALLLRRRVRTPRPAPGAGRGVG